MEQSHMDAVVLIYEYIKKNLFKPEYNCSDYEFKRRSYARWAANEIMNRVTISHQTEPFYIILYFIYQMNKFADDYEKPDAKFIFMTARNTAEEILSLF